MKVTIFNEFIHEKEREHVRKIYPDGIHNQLKSFLESDDVTVRTCTQDDPECGLTEEVLNDTDVLIWWAHVGHKHVADEVAERVQNAVLKGMGIIFLHSAHKSKPFMRLLGSTGNLSWHESGAKERVWVVDPSSPIAEGLGEYFEIPCEETYAEPFDIPQPDRLVFIGWYSTGEVFRSGCCYIRGNGRIFYFQPGHESCPVYHQPEVQTVIRNAVKWAAPVRRVDELDCPHTDPLEG